jgi:4-aminobutyrate--pyruvate transaminase
MFPDWLLVNIVATEPYEALKVESARIGTFGHGFTYGGHPVCAAVACEAIRIYEDERLIEQTAARGKVLEEQLRALEGHPLVGSIRGAA